MHNIKYKLCRRSVLVLNPDPAPKMILLRIRRVEIGSVFHDNKDLDPPWKLERIQIRHLSFWQQSFVRYESDVPYTVCPRSSYPLYSVSYFIKWVTTSWTYWVPQKLSQIYTVIAYICIGKVSWFAVYICGNIWNYTTCFIYYRKYILQSLRIYI